MEDREAQKIRKYEEMFKKQAEMEARKIKRREQKEMTKTNSDPVDRKDNDNSASKKGERSRGATLEPPVIKRPRLESAVSIKTESHRLRHETGDKEISRISSGSKKSVTDRKKHELIEVNDSASDNNSTELKQGKVLSKALAYSIKKTVFDKFKEANTRQGKKNDASAKASVAKKPDCKAAAATKKSEEITKGKPTPDAKNKGKEVMKLMAQSGQAHSIKKVINQSKLYKKGEEFGKKLRDEEIAAESPAEEKKDSAVGDKQKKLTKQQLK